MIGCTCILFVHKENLTDRSFSKILFHSAVAVNLVRSRILLESRPVRSVMFWGWKLNLSLAKE